MSAEMSINDLRAKILKNKEEGLPSDHGIDRDVLRDAIRTLRSSRTLDVKKTTSGKKPKKAAAKKPALDEAGLNNLLGI